MVRFVPIRAGFDPRQVLHTGLLVNFVQASIGPPNINQRLQSGGDKGSKEGVNLMPVGISPGSQRHCCNNTGFAGARIYVGE